MLYIFLALIAADTNLTTENVFSANTNSTNAISNCGLTNIDDICQKCKNPVEKLCSNYKYKDAQLGLTVVGLLIAIITALVVIGCPLYLWYKKNGVMMKANKEICDTDEKSPNLDLIFLDISMLKQVASNDTLIGCTEESCGFKYGNYDNGVACCSARISLSD
eukprot:NODE_496_length_7738_cov_0.394031.p4 type:complete len:163 gc:universal NODE_496_length_7738_cov_0.394031:5053-5541(+)